MWIDFADDRRDIYWAKRAGLNVGFLSRSKHHNIYVLTLPHFNDSIIKLCRKYYHTPTNFNLRKTIEWRWMLAIYFIAIGLYNTEELRAISTVVVNYRQK